MANRVQACAQNARHAGVEVLCCLDSSPARIGQKAFGIPVSPRDVLRRLSSIDAVILSRERDDEAGLRRLSEENLIDPDLPTPSWKDLAQECVLFEEMKEA